MHKAIYRLHPLVEISTLFWLVSLQYVLYAIGWGLCSRLVREHRAAIAHWAVFMLLTAAGYLLVGQRTELRSWWPYAGTTLLFTAGNVALRRGLEHFFARPRRDGEHLAMLAVMGLCLVALGSGEETASWRVIVGYSLNALLFARMLRDVVGPARAEFPAWLVALMVAPALLVLLVSIERTVRQALDFAHPLEWHALRSGSPAMLFSYLVGAALFNLGFTGLVVMRLVQKLSRLSHSDPLTGLLNRRALERQLEQAIDRARRTRVTLALVALDLDNFKRVNDNHGHPAGDAVLTEVAHRLVATARKTDSVARIGGEEFVVLMPNTTAAGAMIAAERLRQAVAQVPIAIDGLARPLPTTVSIGVALFALDEPDAVALMQRADQALYRAKNEGRNRVVM